MKVGATRSGPRSRRTSACSTIPRMPPIAVPKRIPTRSGSYAPSSPASATASRAAPSESRTFRSSLRASFGDGDLRRVEVLDLGGDPHRELARVEGADEVDAALARDGRRARSTAHRCRSASRRRARSRPPSASREVRRGASAQVAGRDIRNSPTVRPKTVARPRQPSPSGSSTSTTIENGGR